MMTIKVSTLKKAILISLAILMVFGTLIIYLLVTHTWLIYTLSGFVALFSVLASAFCLLVAWRVCSIYTDQDKQDIQWISCFN